MFSVFDQANWIVDIKSQRLNVQLFTETKGKLIVSVHIILFVYLVVDSIV